jgi:GH24 family phage-related lysozyme (muramidase)
MEGKIPTIGFGTNIYTNGRKVRLGDTISLEEAQRCLENHILKDLEPFLSRIHAWEEMSDNQKAALTSFASSVEPRFYGSSRYSLITSLCDTPYSWALAGHVLRTFSHYIEVKNHDSAASLKARRGREAELFLKRDEDS